MTHVIVNLAKDTVREGDCSSDSSSEVEFLPHTESLLELVPNTGEKNSPKATITSSPADSTPEFSLSSSNGNEECEEQPENLVYIVPEIYLQEVFVQDEYGESTPSIHSDDYNPANFITPPPETNEQQHEQNQSTGLKRKANQMENSTCALDDKQKKLKLRPQQECHRACQCCNTLATNRMMPPVNAGSPFVSNATCMLKRNELLSSSTNTYQVLKFAGEGSFGQVAVCWVEGTSKLVSIKILKKSLHERKSQREVQILQKLSEECVDGFHVVRLYESFIHKNHLCLVFECLEQSLHDFIKKMNFHIPLNGMRIVLKQLLTTLVKLKELKMIHTDLKTDNIMLVDHEKNPFCVKVIDFGNALTGSLSYHPARVQALNYRSPEVLLGLPFSEKIDMWSLGCVAGEMFLGEILFPGENEYDQIRYIIEAQGSPTNYMLHSATNTNKFFRLETKGDFRTWRLKSPEEEYQRETGIKSQERIRYKLNNLDEITLVNFPQHLKAEDHLQEIYSRKRFISLLKKMLAVDPMVRISPEEALRHDFFYMEN